MTRPRDPTITADALAARLNEPGLLLVDVRDEAAFRSSSLPGAVGLDVYDYFIPDSSPDGVADLVAAAGAAMRAIGADRASTTVFFEEQTGMVSPRGLWFHEFARLAGGLVLDGGIQAWRGATAPGRGMRAGVRSAPAADPVGPVDRDLLATIDDVRDRPASTLLLDVRRRSEHDGSFVHACCARPGRIPGSAFLFWEDLLQDGRYRAPDDIARRARAAGLAPEQAFITYCHRGARAATALYGLRRAGFPHGRVFVGSWHEWADRTDLPAEATAG